MNSSEILDLLSEKLKELNHKKYDERSYRSGFLMGYSVNIEILLIDKITDLISDCEKQANIFRKNNLVNSEISSLAMAQAYKNIKSIILCKDKT